MNGNKLLTSFLVLGMGLSLVACSNDKPESKKEETKGAEKKKEKKNYKSVKLVVLVLVFVLLVNTVPVKVSA